MARTYDHIDLRVPNLAEVTPFYQALLPALGFTRRVESVADMERLAEVAVRAEARNLVGPMPYEPGYHAVFFEDPAGNRLEICNRLEGAR